jgi:phospholipid/cholesterol/gamma-HCH transport system ATP-binding protein
MKIMAQTDPVIRVRGLVTRFGSHIVHEDLSLDVRRGEILGLVGGSGSGKSVLLRSIVGLNQPAAGSIEVFGKQLEMLSEEEYRILERRWGVLFQDGALFSSLTVAQNIQIAMREHLALDQQLMDELAALKIAMVGLDQGAGHLHPSQLSGGMRKRAGLARALALDPEVLFLDEPTAGLDPIGAAAFDSLIRRLRDTLEFTVFLVTHDLDTLYAICDRVAVLGDRRIIAVGTIAELKRHDYPWIQDYFSGPRGHAAAEGHLHAH